MIKFADGFLLRLTILLVLLFLAGCAPSPPPLMEEPSEVTVRVPQDESFDPLSLEEEDLIKLPESSLKPPPPGTVTGGSGTKVEPAGGMEEVLGFRVQLFVSGLEFDARVVEEKALIDFEESVYLIFDPPNYKIRVGDCRTRTEASILRQKAISQGYAGAWVVQCKIISSER